MNRPLVCCKKCKGKGRVLLGDELFVTLQQVRAGQHTAAAIHLALRLDSHVTVINNRLEELRRLNLIYRFKKAGRTWHYKTRMKALA